MLIQPHCKPQSLHRGTRYGWWQARSELRLPNYSKAPQYKAWLNKVRTALCKRAPLRAEAVIEWINAVFKDAATIQDFANSQEFLALDIELADALITLLSGELSREVNAFVDT